MVLLNFDSNAMCTDKTTLAELKWSVAIGALGWNPLTYEGHPKFRTPLSVHYPSYVEMCINLPLK